LQRQPKEFLGRADPKFAGARHVGRWDTALKTLRKVSGQ
jgi:hypothetical protein